MVPRLKRSGATETFSVAELAVVEAWVKRGAR